ncbi:MAG TPA: hypothetical protein VFN61_09590 [Acidimicrobiales bacterium]|nr:hypothetical protein [Acidimicrobiales bacterium]
MSTQWPSLSNWPPTRFAEWRARSRPARLVDNVLFVAGAALIAVPLGDAVGSFWHNNVLIYPATLEHLEVVLIVPTWSWALISAWMVGGLPRHRETWLPRVRRASAWRRRAPWMTTFAVIFVVVVTGFVLGASKGSLRILPGGVHQVSTLDMSSARWTTVSPAGYQKWAARFIREDALFALYGFMLAGFSATMWRLRHRLAEVSRQ